MEQQGFKGEGKLNTASKLWIDSEKQILVELMAKREIEWLQLGTKNQLNSMENSLSYMQDKISSSHEELEQLRNTANDILQYIPDFKKSSKTEKKFDDIRFEFDEQLKNSFMIMRHKDEIRKNIDNLKNITKNSLDLQYKSENTIYDLHQHDFCILS